MINTSTREDSKVNDRALLQVVALSLSPRLQTAGPVTFEADDASTQRSPRFGGTTGTACEKDY